MPEAEKMQHFLYLESSSVKRYIFTTYREKSIKSVSKFTIATAQNGAYQCKECEKLKKCNISYICSLNLSKDIWLLLTGKNLSNLCQILLLPLHRMVHISEKNARRSKNATFLISVVLICQEIYGYYLQGKIYQICVKFHYCHCTG